jgi:hypothetical protein
MIREHDTVVLTEDLPSERLRAGDVAAVVHVHRGGAAYEVEFVTLTSETIAVTTLAPRQLRAVAPGDLAHVRELHAA